MQELGIFGPEKLDNPVSFYTKFTEQLTSPLTK